MLKPRNPLRGRRHATPPPGQTRPRAGRPQPANQRCDACGWVHTTTGPASTWPAWTDIPVSIDGPSSRVSDERLSVLSNRWLRWDDVSELMPLTTDGVVKAVAEAHHAALDELIQAMDSRGLAWLREGSFLIFRHPRSLTSLLRVPMAPYLGPAPGMNDEDVRPWLPAYRPDVYDGPPTLAGKVVGR